MGYVLIKDGVVVQKSCSPEEGFILASDDVVCGYLATEAGFVAPPPTPRSYRDLRAAEYPPAADYLDAIVKCDQAQVDAYIAACRAVKAKYPKGQ